jgi:RNA polymerase sigma-70 factor (sigma-E family)
MNAMPVMPSSPALVAGGRSALWELYGVHYKSLVHLAAMVVRDVGTAEEVVQDTFVAMFDAWSRLADTGKAHAYLRQSVVNRSKSVLRHRAIENKYAAALACDGGTEQAVMTLLERSALVAALRGLPVRQREAVVLRFYGGFSQADVATVMGISRGAVKSHTARGMAALRLALNDAAAPAVPQQFTATGPVMTPAARKTRWAAGTSRP